MRPSSLDPALLLEHGDWLRALARRLAGDDAEDLVQEAYLAALRRPPATDRPLRPWLAQVVRNLAALRVRGRARAAAREQAAESLREAPPSPEELLARAMTLRHLAELVTELEEPLRTTLLLRYDEGLSAERIAELQGAPAGTVRWRLKVALDRLRAGLDERHGDRRWRGAWLLPGLGGTRGGTDLVSVAGGAWLMKKAIAIVVALVLLGGAFWLVRAREDEHAAVGARAPIAAHAHGSAPATVPATRGPAVASGAGVVAPGAGVGAPSGRPALVVADPAPQGAFEGRVINWSTGEGVVGAELTFSAAGVTTTIESGEGGRFELLPASGAPQTLVTASKPGFLPYAPEWGQSPVRLAGRPGERVRDIVFFLFPAIDYSGTVVDPRGQPVAGASVVLLGAPQGEQALETLPDHFTTDAKGRFTFHAPDDAVFEARHPDFGPGRARLDGPVSVSRQLTIRLAPAGQGRQLGRERLAGRVVDTVGAPIGGALVRVAPAREAPAGLPPLQTTSDDDGRFRFDALDPGELALVVSHDAYAPAATSVRAGRSDVVVTLLDGGVLTGRVIDAAGAPVPSFTVQVLARHGLRRERVATRSVVDADGRFEVSPLAPGDYAVLASARGFAPSAEVAARAPGEVVLTLTRGGAVSGRVTSAGGKPIAWARVMLEQSGGASIAPANAGTVTGEDGVFLLTGVPPGTVTLSFGAADHHMRLVAGIQVSDGSTAGPVAVELRPTAPGETPQLELVGIGIRTEPGDDALVVAEVIQGGGAAAAGLLAGDQILAIDGAPVATLGFDGSIGRLRGVEGTRVRLSVRRGEAAPADVVVERRALKR